MAYRFHFFRRRRGAGCDILYPFGNALCGICLAIVSVTRRQQELYKVYVLAGIASIIGFQSIFNMGVTMSLFPTKGMTLPFISYGALPPFLQQYSSG